MKTQYLSLAALAVALAFPGQAAAKSGDVQFKLLATYVAPDGKISDVKLDLIGLPAGQRQIFELGSQDAFGEHNPQLVERIARSALPPEIELRENSLIEFGAPDGGGFAGFLRQLDDSHALIDFNHPLAGKPIRFEVEIIAIL